MLCLDTYLDNTDRWFVASKKGWVMFCHKIKSHKHNMHACMAWLRSNGYVRGGTIFDNTGIVTGYPYKKQYYGKGVPVSPSSFVDQMWEEVQVASAGGVG